MLETSARLLRLLALLQARRFWTGPELSERLEVTERTLRRDVDRLRTLGYPVESSAGVAGGYRLGAGARLPPLLLDDDEALAVALGLRTASAGTVSGIEEAALRALTKLEQVLPERLKRRVKALHAAVVPLYFPRPQIEADILSALAGACRDEVRVLFRYGDGAGRTSDRLAEPHGLVHAGHRWYLLAFDLGKEDWRTFRVDRITGRVTLEGRFIPRSIPGGDAGSFVSRSVASKPYEHQARVLFYAPLERIAARITPLSGHLERLGHDRCRLESGGSSLTGIAIHLAAIGEEFEVESPPELAHEVRALSHRLARATRRFERTSRESSRP